MRLNCCFILHWDENQLMWCDSRYLRKTGSVSVYIKRSRPPLLCTYSRYYVPKGSSLLNRLGWKRGCLIRSVTLAIVCLHFWLYSFVFHTIAILVFDCFFFWLFRMREIRWALVFLFCEFDVDWQIFSRCKCSFHSRVLASLTTLIVLFITLFRRSVWSSSKQILVSRIGTHQLCLAHNWISWVHANVYLSKIAVQATCCPTAVAPS